MTIALLTHWLALRTRIGRPLSSMARSVAMARTAAEHDALHDGLTGLANRRRLDGELQRRAAMAGVLTALHLDLDGFKAINDTLGHAAGDAVLRVVSERLKRHAAPDELVARNGGDEFMILLPPGEGLRIARRRAQEILASLSADIDLGGEACRVGASIGIATGKPRTVEEAARIAANADIALYRAKERGRGIHLVYSGTMREEMEARRELAADIRRGIARREFEPYYRPQVASDGETLVGLEALAHWRHPGRGILTPDRFIAIAGDMGLVERIDGQILERVLEDRATWLADGLFVPRISVNVSARWLRSPRLVDELRNLRVPPDALSFEVLESAVVDKADTSLNWNLDGLRDLGIDVEIDDFGTGHAALASLLAVQPKTLKVARELIQVGQTDGPHMDLLRAIATLGRSLGVGLVADGVETPEQMTLVASLGFERVQGDVIGQPVPAAELRARLASARGRTG